MSISRSLNKSSADILSRLHVASGEKMPSISSGRSKMFVPVGSAGGAGCWRGEFVHMKGLVSFIKGVISSVGGR